MLKTRYLKIHVLPLEDNQYFITAWRNEDEYFPPNDYWKKLLFHRHEESYYGTMLEQGEVNGIEGIFLNGWQLVTLFGKEQFNRLIEWEWDDMAETCLSIAHAIHDSILKKEWMPDFAAWEENTFQWALPARVYSEFDPSFWEDFSTKEFVQNLFNHSLDSYLNRNVEMKKQFGEKLDALRKQHVSPKDLALYFDEESWQEWIGAKETNIPFTLGLKLEEPSDIDSFWNLEIFLRDKKNPALLIDQHDTSNFPKKWLAHVDLIESEQQRWIKLFPWLKGVHGITNRLTEEEAWTFLTESSETMLALGVDILLPSWWQAMKDASLKVKARIKGSTASHRQSFVGLQAMLDYDWRFSMNGVDLTEEEFHQMVEEKRRLVFIRGRWIKLDPTFIKQIQDLMKKAEKEGLHVRDLIEQELISANNENLDELENNKAFAKIQIELNRQWKQMVHQLKEIKNLPIEPLPKSFQGELRPYQELGMSWLLFLRRYGFGAILADDMGLGSAKRSHISAA